MKQSGHEDKVKESLRTEKISFHLINGNKAVPRFSGTSPENSAESDSDASSKQTTEEQDLDESYITEESIMDDEDEDYESLDD